MYYNISKNMYLLFIYYHGHDEKAPQHQINKRNYTKF